MNDTPDEISASLVRLVHSYSDADELFNAVRKAHPTARKKDVVIAALSVMIEQAQTDEIATRRLHTMALRKRGGEV